MLRAILDVVAELLLLFLQLHLERLVGAPHGLALEQPIDLLQRDTTGFGDEEEGEEEGQEGERGEEEVYAVVHGDEHLLGEAGDEEVEEPVAGGREGLSQGTEVGVEEFLLRLLVGVSWGVVTGGDVPS